MLAVRAAGSPLALTMPPGHIRCFFGQDYRDPISAARWHSSTASASAPTTVSTSVPPLAGSASARSRARRLRQEFNFEELTDPERDFVPPSYQQEAARAASDQAGAGSAAIRYRFIARQEASAPSPPLARILRGGGGRGGATRLKVYLSLLWLTRNRNLERPVFAFPAQQLAALLGLPSPEDAGARRVQEALRWLAKEGFVALDRRPGDVTRVHVLDDAGSGEPYQPPGRLTTRAPRRSQKEREQHFYVQLDARFWTEGWITQLSGVAVAMYLACLYEQRGRSDEAIWVSPRMGRERYDLSDETRNKGLRELTDRGLLSLARRPVPATSFFDDRFRARNVYLIQPGAWARSKSPQRHRSAPGAKVPPPPPWAQ